MTDNSSNGLHADVSMKDVERVAGVSHGAVSNFFNHPERVSESTRRRIAAAVADLGYVRDETARQLRAGTSATVGLSLLDGWNPFFNTVTTSIEGVIRDGGYELFVVNSSGYSERESRNLQAFASRRMAGILAVTHSPSVVDQLVVMQRRGIPTVLVDQGSRILRLPSVSVDNLLIGRLAGEHLAGLDRRRVWYVGIDDPHDDARLQGCAHGLRKNQMLQRIQVPDHSIGTGEAVGNSIGALASAERPDAIFAATDLLALGMMGALIRQGLRVPEDVAIIGVDDIAFARHSMIPLTTIRQPATEMGRTAAAMLLQYIRSGVPADPRSVTLAPELIVRNSA
ncbi:MAG: LacI family DNA-binding transcriptional regulator [Beutenbergiaceae bacterium]